MLNNFLKGRLYKDIYRLLVLKFERSRNYYHPHVNILLRTSLSCLEPANIPKTSSCQIRLQGLSAAMASLPTPALKPFYCLSSSFSISTQRSFLPFHSKMHIMLPMKLSCRSGEKDSHETPTDGPSRRNLLIALGGFYGSTASKAFGENSKPARSDAIECPDSVNHLGHKPRDVYNPWINVRPARAETGGRSVAEPTFPVTLETSNISLTVKRPPINGRKKSDEEALFLQGIELDKTKAVKFDVYVNAPPEALRKAAVAECAGSFVNVPHLPRLGAGRTMKTNLKLAITDLLKHLEAVADEAVVVTLVPRTWTPVKIGAISIELI